MKSMLSTQAAVPLTGQESAYTHVITVTSGKGGVGKTNVVANLAVALAQAGKQVLVLDADLGLGNIDVLLGLVPRYTLEHVLAGSHHLSDIVIQGPAGIHVLPASSGLPQLTSLNDEQQLLLQSELEDVAKTVDVLLIDTGAGIASNVTYFAAAAQETVIVVSPEPTSLTDAYALIKVLWRQHRERR
ncbi:MAG: AAA family ATPase, partial [Nitrospira sp.]|nr:AAA family ATPase [Nitrospira sp.]